MIDYVLYDSAPAEVAFSAISIEKESFDDVDNSFKSDDETTKPKIRKKFPETFIWDKIDEYEAILIFMFDFFYSIWLSYVPSFLFSFLPVKNHSKLFNVGLTRVYHMNAEMDMEGNAAPQMAVARGGVAKSSKALKPLEIPKIRKDFPETWIFTTIDDFGLVAPLSDNSECFSHNFDILLHQNVLLITTFL